MIVGRNPPPPFNNRHIYVRSRKGNKGKGIRIKKNAVLLHYLSLGTGRLLIVDSDGNAFDPTAVPPVIALGGPAGNNNFLQPQNLPDSCLEFESHVREPTREELKVAEKILATGKSDKKKERIELREADAHQRKIGKSTEKRNSARPKRKNDDKKEKPRPKSGKDAEKPRGKNETKAEKKHSVPPKKKSNDQTEKPRTKNAKETEKPRRKKETKAEKTNSGLPKPKNQVDTKGSRNKSRH